MALIFISNALKMSSAICFNLGQSKILLTGHGLNQSSDRILICWLVVLGFNATLTTKVISWWSVTHVFPGFLTPVLTQLSFPKPPTSFLTCFSRGERQKYAGKKVCLNRGSNSQPLGHESDTLRQSQNIC